jgi:hypothetical protein
MSAFVTTNPKLSVSATAHKELRSFLSSTIKEYVPSKEITAPRVPKIRRPQVRVAKTPRTTAKETAQTAKINESRSDPAKSWVTSSLSTDPQISPPTHNNIPAKIDWKAIVSKYFFAGDTSRTFG